MPTLIVYGASDDLVSFSGAINEEFDATPSWRGRIYSPDGESLIISAVYGEGEAEWTIRVENSNTWPSWPMHFTERPDMEGDPALVLEVPEGTKVHPLPPKRFMLPVRD